MYVYIIIFMDNVCIIILKSGPGLAGMGLVWSKLGPKIESRPLGLFIKIKAFPFRAFLGLCQAGYPHLAGQIDRPCP